MLSHRLPSPLFVLALVLLIASPSRAQAQAAPSEAPEPHEPSVAPSSAEAPSVVPEAPEASQAAPDEPWTLHSTLRAPAWLILEGSTRVRYGGLRNQFRPGLDENDQVLALRTLVTLGARLGPLSVVGELQDSRAYLTDDNSGASTIVVNSMEPLQAYVGLYLEDSVLPGDSLDIRVGRQTMDVGSRRLIARNTYRNTIQNFNGVTARWRSAEGAELLVFGVLPVPVAPNDREGILDNEIEIDRERFDQRFWGLRYEHPLPRSVALEAYIFGLHEGDSRFAQTRDRQLYTPGVRAYRAPKAGEWDIDLESVAQFGTHRATTAEDDTTDVRVLAFFQHAAVGYTLDAPWKPRLAAELDYGSGDFADSDRYQRFDSLFGPRRADFGPTGIYGPLGRENVISAGLRLSVKPSDRVDAFLSWRANALAALTDSFSRTGVRDPAGQSGRFGANQLELRVRTWLVPKVLLWELGGAAFIEGQFMEQAPNATGYGDPLFVYSDLALDF